MLEADISKHSKGVTVRSFALQDLRSKLEAAEQLCEELMDENEDYKKEIRQMEDEIEEMQDNFREDQADEYRDLKRELEQRAKDCRVLQFKLKKSERRADCVRKKRLFFKLIRSVGSLLLTLRR